ncbi:MAG: glycoside hydrolase domain-containing protein [Dysgonomonas sp.]
MKKLTWVIGILLILISRYGYSQTFEELADPLRNWEQVPAGLNASIASIDKRYAKNDVPFVKQKSSCEITGWKGEKLSAQLLLWSVNDVEQIECTISDFSSSNNTLPANIAQTRFVRYVMTDEFGPGCGYRKPEDFPASLSADMLDNIKSFNLAAKTVRPVWITVEIPRDAQADIYKSKIRIMAKGEKSQEFEIILNVQNKVLPPAREWTYHLDLWQHPSAVARAQNLKLWSDEHFEALKPLMKMLADAGQKVITTNVNKDPWNVQTFDPYADMIIWTKDKKGKWSYDYTIFDKWVMFMMDLGVDKMINCYSLVPWNNELHYKDAKGNIITVKADPGTKEFEEMWGPFLTDFTKHLKEKGWLHKTNIAMDERAPKEMEATIEFLQRTAPELGISLADNHNSYKKYPFIKEISVSADAKVDSADIAMRRQKGLITTYYVCCSDKFPNVFTFSDSAEAVYSAWYALAADYDGYLRWAYNSWVENPLTDSRFRTWPAGDTYIVYPEARSSIRFERLVEGIQDIEKIRILRKELKRLNTKESLEKLARLNREIARFNTISPLKSPDIMLNRAKVVVNEVSK